MAKYCKFCGLPIEEGKECNCEGAQNSKKQSGTTASDMKNKFKENVGIPNEKGRAESYERGKQIVPDCITANEGEVPIRQYDIAVLRSIMKGASAEGKLQVTNQRVLFRASGFSLLGPNKMQYEFAINEIAGIEIRNDHRLGIFHLFVSGIAVSYLTSAASSIFNKIAGVSSFLSGILALVLFAWAMLFFVSVKRKQFFKLFFNSIAAGALSVHAFTTKFMVIPMLSGNISSFIEGICLIVLLINIIMIAFVPNLVLEVKTKGANSSIEIRRKESNGILAFMFNMPKKEYTGYSDVMPGKDIEKARKELGALINDVNMLGDEAVEKWREKYEQK